MEIQEPRAQVVKPLRTLVLFVVGTAVFATAYCQAPLYYSNQNQYFLHGLANAGEGLLKEDWLAGTWDPTPVFSGLVAFSVRWLHPWTFHFYYALLQGVYAAAMVGLFFGVVGEEAGRRRWPIFVALLVAVHAALGRWGSYRLAGDDYPWFLQGGLAGQYVLGAMFQPSTFGVLLIVAVGLFVRDRPFLAAIFVAMAATVHTTYLLPGGLLVLGFMAALVMEGRRIQAVGVGALALAFVLPVTVHVLWTFGPTSAETFAQTQAILVNFRIPHHARPNLWLDEIAVLQIAWVILSVILARPGRLYYVMLVAFLGGLVLTLAQVATGSDTLALLFPWRVSAVLVPMATTVILARLVGTLPLWVEGRAARIAVAGVVAVCVAGGVWISAARQGFRTNDDELPLMEWVRKSRKMGDVYFLPVRVPDLVASTRGSLSSDFKPLAQKKQDARIIPVDMQRFRLHTGAPIFVDFKSIPYKDTEVLEWRGRIRVAQAVQEQIREGKLGEALGELRRRGVTHLVLPAGQNLESRDIAKIYEDGNYRVWRVRFTRASGGKE